jgi:hypothetical protein
MYVFVNNELLYHMHAIVKFGFSCIMKYSLSMYIGNTKNIFLIFIICSFTATRTPGISIMFPLATLVYINEYKTQSNCNQDPTFRHSSPVA